MKILRTLGLLVLALQFSATAIFAQSTPNATPMLWDDGLTHEGTRFVTNSTTVSSNFLYRLTTLNPSLGAWRTALTVSGGEAHLYLSRSVPPTTTVYNFKSDRPGSDGILL